MGYTFDYKGGEPMKGKRERTIITILVALAITIAMFTTFPSSELKTFLPPDVYGKWYAFSIGQTISWNLLFYFIIWLTEHKNRIQIIAALVLIETLFFIMEIMRILQ